MDAANVAGFTWSMERFRGYFPLGQRKYDFSGGQTLTFFIKIQFFHWDKKKNTERLFYLLPVMFQVFASIRKFIHSAKKHSAECKGVAKMNQMGAQFLEVQCNEKGTCV